jgi:hypothetical protein
MSPHNVSGNGAAIYKSTQAPLGRLDNNAPWEFDVILALNQTATCAIRAGVCQSPNGSNPGDGLWVEYDSSNTGNSDTDFTWATKQSGTTNYYTSHAIAADTLFHHFRIRSISAGTVLFSVDGGAEAPVTTQLPILALQPFVQVFTRANTFISAIVDLVSYEAATGRV